MLAIVILFQGLFTVALPLVPCSPS